MPHAAILEAELTNPPYGGGFTATNITRYLLMDRPDSVRVRRGRTREYDEVQAGTLSLSLDDLDGRFTPESAASPYYPGVKRRRRIRLRHQHWVKNLALNSNFEAGFTPVRDAFGRTVANGWGTADAGGSWTNAGGAAGDYAVNSGVGKHTLNTTNASRRTVIGSAIIDSDQRATTKVPVLAVGSFIDQSLMSRYKGGADYYQAQIRFQTSGNYDVQIRQTTTAGGFVTLAQVTGAGTYVAGDTFWIRMWTVQNVIKVKVWKTSVSQPSAWTVEYNQATAEAGQIGCRSLVDTGFSGGTVTVEWDSYDGSSAPDYWTPGGSLPPAITRSSVHAQDGTSAMLVEWDAGGSFPLTQTTIYGLDIGSTYTASAYVWVPTGDPAVQLVIAGVGLGSASAVNDAFTRITFTFTATETFHLLQVWPTSAPAAGDLVWVDAVQVEAGGSATTFDSTDAYLTDRFFGYVNDWTVETHGKDAVCKVTATDALKSLAKKTIRPFLVEESFNSLTFQPLAYYQLAETDDATTSASDIAMRGALPLAVTQVNSGGDIQWGQGIGPSTDGLSAPIFAPASATQGYVLRGVVAPSGLTYPFTIELWFVTSTNSRTIATLHGPSQVLELALDGSGALQVNRLSLGGTTQVTNTFATGNLANGALHHISVVLTSPTGANNIKVQVDGATATTLPSVASSAWGSFTTLTVGGRTFGTESLFNGTIAHAVVFDADAQTSAFRVTVGNTASAERSDLRFNKIALYSGYAFNTTADVGLSDIEGSEQYQGGRASLDMLRQVAVSENGIVIANRDGSLGFQSRGRRYNAAAAFTLDVDLAEQLDQSYDDQQMANTIRVTRPHGADVVVVNAQAKTDHGPDEATINTLVTTDAEALGAAQWHAQRLGDPPPQLPGIAVEASTLGTTLYRQILAADVSTMFTASSLPAQAPATSLNAFIEGYDELIGPQSHVFVFNTSRANLSTVWQLDSSAYSVLGTTTRLAY